jgi:hypothetical protein
VGTWREKNPLTSWFRDIYCHKARQRLGEDEFSLDQIRPIACIECHELQGGRKAQNFLPCNQANGRMEDTPMKRTLEQLFAEADLSKVLEVLSEICKGPAKRARRANQLDVLAQWKCDYDELMMTSNSVCSAKLIK